jgi:uridine kinase
VVDRNVDLDAARILPTSRRAPTLERCGLRGPILPPVSSRERSPIVIGVAGGSGSGKTTVVRRIVDSLGSDEVSVLEHDRYYRDRPDLRLEDRAALNYDHPDSLETDLMVRHVAELKQGRAVEAPLYDFARYARGSTTEAVAPRRCIIVEGILIFADAALREQMDIKVFVDTDDDTRFIRRLRRDVAERGRSMDSVIEQYLGTVKPMHLEFVQPSKRYADVIIPRGGHNPVAIDLLLTLIRSLVPGR